MVKRRKNKFLINAHTHINKLNKKYFIPELTKNTKHFIPNWKIMIYYSYRATSKEMLPMHVQLT
jgi:hypothetical protein